jgi:hypothetical protein
VQRHHNGEGGGDQRADCRMGPDHAKLFVGDLLLGLGVEFDADAARDAFDHRRLSEALQQDRKLGRAIDPAPMASLTKPFDLLDDRQSAQRCGELAEHVDQRALLLHIERLDPLLQDFEAQARRGFEKFVRSARPRRTPASTSAKETGHGKMQWRAVAERAELRSSQCAHRCCPLPSRVGKLASEV